MRLLRLDLDSGHSIDLHPFVTLARDLTDADRAGIVNAVQQLGLGSTAGLRGLVQHQGLLVELDGAPNEHLFIATGAEVAIDTEALDGADLNWLRDRIDLQRCRAEIAAVAVEEIRADLTPSALAELRSVQRQLDPTGQGESDTQRALRCQLEDAVAAVAGTDRWLLSAPDGVVELRARRAAHTKKAADAAKHLGRLEETMARAHEQVEITHRQVEVALVEAKPPLLTQEEEARLELLTFPSMDETRKGKWRKNLRPDEQAEMDQLLNKVDVESWTAYTVYRSSPTVPWAKQESLDHARTGVTEAEQNLVRVQATVEEDPVRRELAAEQEEIRCEARLFLGMMLPPDIDSALAELTSTTDNPEWQRAVDVLVAAMAANRIPHDPADVDAMLGTARDRLGGISGGQPRSKAILRQEQDRLRCLFDAHRRALGRLDGAESVAAQAALGLAQLEEQLATSGADDASGVDAVLARIEPIATQVALEDRGSLPVVLFGEIPVSSDGEVARLMSRLSELSADLQIIVISSRSAVVDWIAGVGLDCAMVSGPKMSVVVSSF